MRTFYATMLVTRVEQWWVEAASAEEAHELFASGQGHHASMGERVHVEVGMMSEDAASEDAISEDAASEDAISEDAA